MVVRFSHDTVRPFLWWPLLGCWRVGLQCIADFLALVGSISFRICLRHRIARNAGACWAHWLPLEQGRFKGMTSLDKLNPALRHLLRTPGWLAGSAAGSTAGLVNSALSDCVCKQ